MSQESQKKIRLGKKEKAIIEFLKQHEGSAWKEDVLQYFAYSQKYRTIMVKRLYRMQQKGLIEIKLEQNPAIGKLKQKVYLKQ